MIESPKSFKSKKLRQLFLEKRTQGFEKTHIKRLRLILQTLNAAIDIQDLYAIPALKCHALRGQMQGHYAVWVNKNWRVTFTFENGLAGEINYEDYHDGKIKR